MDTALAELVKKSVFEYAGGGVNHKTFAMVNEEKQAYAVLIVDTPIHQQEAGIVVMARLVGDYVIVEEDTTGDPFFHVLLKRGIPREKIILAYRGEALPA
jgi:hypothetical protein